MELLNLEILKSQLIRETYKKNHRLQPFRSGREKISTMWKRH